MAGNKNGQDLIRSLEAKGFYSDCEKEGCLYAVLVRSPVQNGKINSITISELPEGYYFYTAKDIPHSKTMEFNNTSTKIFGYDNILYNGEPLGILIGPDEQKVNSLLEDVNISFDIEDLEDALKNVIDNQDSTDTFKEFVEQLNDMPSLDTVIDKSHIATDHNVIVAKREVKYGLYKTLPVEQADSELFTNAFYSTQDSWKETERAPMWKETEGAFCYMEGENLHVYVPTKWTYFAQQTIANTLNIPPQQIFIHKTKSSNSYTNGLWRTSQIATQVALASYLSKKPVKLVFSQKEQETYMSPGVQVNFTYKSAIDENGIITALKINIDIDIGSSNPFAQEITDRIAIAACNYYKTKNLYILVNTHTSKNPPTTISQRTVDSQAFFAIENQIQKICYQTDIFPDELRLKNSKIENDSESPFPFKIPIENEEEVLQTVLANSDFNRKYASFHMEAIDRLKKTSNPFFALPLRGIGVATGYNTSGYAGESAFTYKSKIDVTLEQNEQLTIHAIKPSEVIQNIWKSAAAEILQIPKQNIYINSDFEINQIPQTPEESISSIGIMTECIKKCCNDIQKKRFHDPLPLSASKTVVPFISKNWDKDSFSGTPYYTSSFISTVVEVELDTYTYGEKIKGIWVTINCGELFDEQAAIRTIKMEIQQELTTLVQGKNVNCDYINIAFVKSNAKAGQLSGLIHNTLPAAFASALSLALTTQLTELPCTESQLFELIKNRTIPVIEGEQK